MPKIDLAAALNTRAPTIPLPSTRPAPSASASASATPAGLTDFGVNLMRLPVGGWSSQRHWHSHEDEFVYVLEGELTLVEDAGETILRAGDCATFRKTRRRPSYDQQIGRDGRLSRSRFPVLRTMSSSSPTST